MTLNSPSGIQEKGHYISQCYTVVDLYCLVLILPDQVAIYPETFSISKLIGSPKFCNKLSLTVQSLTLGCFHIHLLKFFCAHFILEFNIQTCDITTTLEANHIQPIDVSCGHLELRYKSY